MLRQAMGLDSGEGGAPGPPEPQAPPPPEPRGALPASRSRSLPTSRRSRLTRREASGPLTPQPPPRSSPEREDKGRRRLATLRHVTATLRRRQF